MTPKRVYLRAKELEEQFMCERMVSCNAAIGSCNVKYTDMSQLWHDASDIPNDDSLIIYESVYGDILLKRFTNRASAMANVLRWAYVNDLLPKGGKE